MASQRKHVRHLRRIRVSMASVPAYTTEIGAGGFSMEVARLEKVGTKVEGTLRLQGSEVAFQGVVSWARPGDPARGRPARMGVRFTVLASEMRRLLSASVLPETP